LNIAVVGAGLSGLACALELQRAGHKVTVFEKGQDAGGRMATRETELGGFDHGAQYFTVTDPSFRRAVDGWSAAGLVAPWEGRIVALAGGRSQQGTETRRYVGVPGMNAVARMLAADLDLRCEARIASVERLPAWHLGDETGSTHGPFDAVALAVPADQALPLLAADPVMAASASRARLDPCWALMLGFPVPLALDYDGAFSGNHRIAWIARENSKPGRRPGERWVVHARPDWSSEHVEDDPDDVRIKLLKSFHELTGTAVQPIHAVVHRWRYASVPAPLDAPCLWNPAIGLGACGDWCGGPRIEGAWLSGSALAAAVTAT
jgi:renalase